MPTVPNFVPPKTKEEKRSASNAQEAHRTEETRVCRQRGQRVKQRVTMELPTDLSPGFVVKMCLRIASWEFFEPQKPGTSWYI